MTRVTEVVLTEAFKSQIGEYAVDRIKKRTRLGKGVAELGASPEKLKPLSASYIKQRVKQASLNAKTKPKKSNLTRSGEMLDSLTFEVQGDSIIIGFDKRSAEKKAGYVSEDRPFLTLSKPEYAGLIRLVRKEVLRLLRG